MKRCLVLVSFLVAVPCFAEPPAPEAVVQSGLLQPLAAKENKRSRFSRSAMPAQERRVRILDVEPMKDSRGKAFVTFAVDARHGVFEAAEENESAWRKDALTGCVYPESGEIFVKRGDAFQPAAVLLGKKVNRASEHACQAEPVQVITAL